MNFQWGDPGRFLPRVLRALRRGTRPGIALNAPASVGAYRWRSGAARRTRRDLRYINNKLCRVKKVRWMCANVIPHSPEPYRADREPVPQGRQNVALRARTSWRSG